MKNSDFDLGNKVVQSNYLIQYANNVLDAIPLKAFKALISCIDVMNPPKDNRVRIKKTELLNILNTNDYAYVKKKVREIQATSVKLVENEHEEVYVSLCSNIHWKRDIDIVECRFDEELMPYLINLKEFFTQYEIADLKSLKSRYSVIMYEYLLSLLGQYENRSQHFVSIEDLRRLTGTEKVYERILDFEKKVLVPAKREINQAPLNFLMTYVKEKSGRKVSGFTFILRDRTSSKEKDFFDFLDDENVADGQLSFDDIE